MWDFANLPIEAQKEVLQGSGSWFLVSGFGFLENYVLPEQAFGEWL
jgi:hypothetical protein